MVWPWPDEVKCPTMEPSLVDPGVEADARGDTTLCLDTLRPFTDSQFLKISYLHLEINKAKFVNIMAAACFTVYV